MITFIYPLSIIVLYDSYIISTHRIQLTDISIFIFFFQETRIGKKHLFFIFFVNETDSTYVTNNNYNLETFIMIFPSIVVLHFIFLRLLFSI